MSQHDDVLEITALLAARGPMRLGDVAVETHLSPDAVRHRLDVALRAGVVYRAGRGVYAVPPMVAAQLTPTSGSSPAELVMDRADARRRAREG